MKELPRWSALDSEPPRTILGRLGGPRNIRAIAETAQEETPRRLLEQLGRAFNDAYEQGRDADPPEWNSQYGFAAYLGIHRSYATRLLSASYERMAGMRIEDLFRLAVRLGVSFPRIPRTRDEHERHVLKAVVQAMQKARGRPLREVDGEEMEALRQETRRHWLLAPDCAERAEAWQRWLKRTGPHGEALGDWLVCLPCLPLFVGLWVPALRQQGMGPARKPFLEKLLAARALHQAFAGRWASSLDDVARHIQPACSAAALPWLLETVGLSEADCRDESLALGQLIERSPVLRDAFLNLFVRPNEERSDATM